MKSLYQVLAVSALLTLSACGNNAQNNTQNNTTGDASADTTDKVDTSKDETKGPDAGPDDSGDTLEDGSKDDTPDQPPVDPCDDATPRTLQVRVPFGETLFLDSDDYLYFWNNAGDCEISLASSPGGAGATINEGRLTPDVAGQWVLKRGGDTVQLQVDTDFLTQDTFLNYNYSPNEPLLRQGQTLYVTATTSNRVDVFDLSGQTPTRTSSIPTGSWPTALAMWETGSLPVMLVAQTGRDSVGFVDVTSGRVVDAMRVGDEPSVLRVVGDELWVALRGEDAVRRIDLTTKQVLATIEVGRAPRAMLMDTENNRLYVASSLSMSRTPYGQIQGQTTRPEDLRDITVIDTTDNSVVGHVPQVGTILRGFERQDGHLFVSFSEARNEQSGVEANSRPHTHGVARVSIDPSTPPEQWNVAIIDLDAQAPAPSPHSMLRLSGGPTAVTLSAGKAVAMVNGLGRITQRITVGHDPRGLVEHQGHLYTYSWLSNTLDRVDLATNAVTSVEVGDDPTPERVREGQVIFNDANFSANKDFSCNNCHIDGLTDGLVWNILLDGDVNTLSFRNIGSTAPFLWGGQLPTLFDFSREVLRLVGAEATGEQMDKLTTYMQSVTAPPNPHAMAGGQHSAQGEAGRALFQGKANCGGCHATALFTNQEAVPGKTQGFTTDTPSLIATYDSGPWGRQAQWRTIEEMVAYAVTFSGSSLTPQELADLSQYVRELPGDALFLNSAQPLDGNNYVWTQRPIELVFSAVLAPNQADKLSIEYRPVDSGQWAPYPGSWEISGRVARFKQTAAAMPERHMFRITAASGLGADLGQRLSDPIVVEYTTGEAPSTDVSGKWEWFIDGAFNGSVTIAFIQSAGGRVSGAILDTQGGIDFDHVEGYVTGTRMIIDPFVANVSGNDVAVQSVEIDLVEMTPRDGYADSGTGTLRSIIDLGVQAQRVSLPQNP